MKLYTFNYKCNLHRLIHLWPNMNTTSTSTFYLYKTKQKIGSSLAPRYIIVLHMIGIYIYL